MAISCMLMAQRHGDNYVVSIVVIIDAGSRRNPMSSFSQVTKKTFLPRERSQVRNQSLKVDITNVINYNQSGQRQENRLNLRTVRN